MTLLSCSTCIPIRTGPDRPTLLQVDLSDAEKRSKELGWQVKMMAEGGAGAPRQDGGAEGSGSGGAVAQVRGRLMRLQCTHCSLQPCCMLSLLGGRGGDIIGWVLVRWLPRKFGAAPRASVLMELWWHLPPMKS